MANLEIFGDSITYGLGDPEGGGWAERIRRTMMARIEGYHDLDDEANRSNRPRAFVFNNAELGMTVPNMVDCIPSILERRARRRFKDPMIVAVMAGFSEHAAKNYNPNVSIYDFRTSLHHFSKKLRESEFKVISLFVELPLFDFKRPHPLNDGTFKLDLLTDYQEVVKYHAEQTDAHYIPIANALRQLTEDPIGRDGIHPSSVGHAAIHDIVLCKIDELLGPQ